MEEITKKTYEIICIALENYYKGERDIKELYDVLKLVHQEWEYITHGL